MACTHQNVLGSTLPFVSQVTSLERVPISLHLYTCRNLQHGFLALDILPTDRSLPGCHCPTPDSWECPFSAQCILCIAPRPYTVFLSYIQLHVSSHSLLYGPQASIHISCSMCSKSLETLSLLSMPQILFLPLQLLVKFLLKCMLTSHLSPTFLSSDLHDTWVCKAYISVECPSGWFMIIGSSLVFLIADSWRSKTSFKKSTLLRCNTHTHTHRGTQYSASF